MEVAVVEVVHVAVVPDGDVTAPGGVRVIVALMDVMRGHRPK
jgi:hypothetical protein